MKVVYIAGTGHSGSTLLSLMLNAHPDVISVGELSQMPRQLQSKNAEGNIYSPCSCGAPSVMQCQFWERALKLMENRSGRSFESLSQELSSSVEANEIVFEAISDVSGNRIVVDSSKMWSRLNLLFSSKKLEIFPIHLIRGPQGQIFSSVRKHGKLLKQIYMYERTHWLLRRRLKDRRHCRIAYEDLVLKPEETISQLMSQLGLKLSPDQLHWAEQEKHLLAGNRLRLGEKSRLVLDNRWEQGLSRVERLAISVGTLGSRRLVKR